MPLKYPPPPDDSVKRLTDFLVRKSVTDTGGGAATRMMAEGARARPDQMLPHRLYSADINSLATGGSIANATRPGAWRYLVPVGPRSLVAAEVDAEGDVTREFARANQGPFAEQTLEFIQEVSQDPLVQAGEFEVRVLAIPSLFVFALWLHSEGGDQDRFIPMGPTDRRIRVRHRYDEESFRAILQELAVERLRMSNEP